LYLEYAVSPKQRTKTQTMTNDKLAETVELLLLTGKNDGKKQT
jgi:hypothetical protein